MKPRPALMDKSYHNRSIIFTLKPSKGGLEQLVTNLRSFRFSGSPKSLTTSQKLTTVSWVSLNPLPYFVFSICR